MKTLEELRQTVDIGEITKKVKSRRGGRPSGIEREKTDWLGVCYFLDGNAWLYIGGDNCCIGKEVEIRKACKLYNTDVENPSDIKNAMIRWRREGYGLSGASGEVAERKILVAEKSQSYHFVKGSKDSIKDTKAPISQPQRTTGRVRGHGEVPISEGKQKQLVLV